MPDKANSIDKPEIPPLFSSTGSLTESGSSVRSKGFLAGCCKNGPVSRRRPVRRLNSRVTGSGLSRRWADGPESQKPRSPPQGLLTTCGGTGGRTIGVSPRSLQTQARHPQQIVATPCKIAPRLRPLPPPDTHSDPIPHRLHSPQNLLHLLAKLLVETVTRLGCRASVRAPRTACPTGARVSEMRGRSGA